MINTDGTAKYPGGYADYITNHERRPGLGPLAGWRGEDGESYGAGASNPDQLQRYIDNEGFCIHPIPPEHQFYRFANQGYLDWAKTMGYVTSSDQIVMKIYSEALQTFVLAARGHGRVQPPETHRQRIAEHFDPLPIWYAPLEEGLVDTEEFPPHALTQRPMHMYHSWGSQNAWLRQIPGAKKMYISTRMGAQLGIANDDWI